MSGAGSRLPIDLYRADQVREIDRIAIEELGIPGAMLMARAGAAAFEALRVHWPQARRIAVICGTGNNAGDGLVVARLAREAQLDARLLQVDPSRPLCGDALAEAEAWQAAGGITQPFSPDALSGTDVLVDAMFGTGLDRDVSGLWREAVEAVNRSGLPVLAIDIPSGLHADTGRVLGAAVRAALTVTFMGLKQGLFTGQGPDHCGMILFHDLDVPRNLYARVPAAARRLDRETLGPLRLRRPRSAHKGRFGHVLVIGGEQGMSGAVRLAAEAAARVGAGLVSVATRAAHAAVLNLTRPELMCHGVEQAQDLDPLIDRANAVAVGPGLGRSSWARALLDRATAGEKPLVVDADALNLLAGTPSRRELWVLTPHPGEAARLLGCDTAEVERDRFAAVAALVHRYGGVCVLKGAGTLIGSGDGPVAVCTAGNPGMASGGMGDVLSGVIAGLIAQGLPLRQAAEVGVGLHAAAADRAACEGERGMLATDLMPHLRRLANPH